MPFSSEEVRTKADKLSLQISGGADASPGKKFWYNEQFAWSPITPPTKIWTDFATIPGAGTPGEADTAVTANPTIMEKRTLRLTLDITTNSRQYIARSTYGDHSSATYEDWIQPALIRDAGSASAGYIIRLYHGDPAGAGVELPTTYLGGADGAPSWEWNYSSGILKVSTDQSATYGSHYNTNGLWVVGYRYIGDSGGGTSIPDGAAEDQTLTWDNAGGAWQVCEVQLRGTNADANIGLGINAISSATGIRNIGIGFGTGVNLLGGYQNTLVGNYAFAQITTQSSNCALGYYAGFWQLGGGNIAIGDSALLGSNGLSTAGNVIAIGNRAFASFQSGGYNIAIGYHAGEDQTIATYNTLIGYEAGVQITTSSYNTFIGGRTGWDITDASGYNVAIGSWACRGNRSFCTAIGNNALATNDTGGGNVAIGYSAGYAVSTGTGNSFIGNSAGEANTTGTNNLCIGPSSMRRNTTGSYSAFLGYQAGYGQVGLTTGGDNCAIGFRAMYSYTTGSNNTAIGKEALYSIEGNNGNVAIGPQAGYHTQHNYNLWIGASAGYGQSGLSTGYFNTGIGYQTQYDYTTALFNTSIGYRSLWNITTGGSNTAIGSDVLSALTTGTNNVAVGQNAGKSCSSSLTYGVFIGYSAGFNVDGANNVAIGNSAMTGSATACPGTYNVAIGLDTLRDLVGGNYNIMLGATSGKYLTSGVANIGIGYQTAGALAILTGADNVCIGSFTGEYLTSGYRNFLGCISAGHNISTGYDNVCIGYQSGRDLSSGYSNVFLGLYAGDDFEGGAENVAIGYHALSNNLNGNYNIGIGHLAGFTANNSYMIAIGAWAGYSYYGTESVMIGTNAGKGTVSYSGANNTVIGYQAMFQANTAVNANVFIGSHTAAANAFGGHNNVGVGHGAGWSLTTGSNNVFLGRDTGVNITTGGGNVFIGYQVGGSWGVGSSNYLAIHNANTAQPLIFGDFSSRYVTIHGFLDVYGTTGLGWIRSFDNNHSIIIRGDRDSNVVNEINYYEYGNTISGGGAHNFWAGGVLASQTLKLSIATDKSHFYHDLGVSGDIRVSAGVSLGATADAENGMLKFATHATSGEPRLQNYITTHGWTLPMRYIGEMEDCFSSYIYNYGIGIGALVNCTLTGQGNVAMGYNAANITTTGDYNTCIGYNTSPQTNSASYCVSIGYGCWADSNAIAIGDNATAYQVNSIAIGDGANTQDGYTGGVAIGTSTHAYDSYDIALGWGAEANGPYSIAIGVNSGSTGASSYGIAIGANADNATNTRSIAIGYGVVNTGTYQTMIANIYGNTGAATADVIINSNNILKRSTSSRRYKTNITDLDYDSSLIFNLRPVSFDSISDDEPDRYTGFIAEEVVEHIPQLVTFAKSKDVIRESDSEEMIPDQVQYTRLVAPMLEEMKKMRNEINELKAQINS